ncbi:hypothetical protein HU200_013408 [Digitaria exilis]|uniref:Uncharacterized protein n=1 Tax=Digitaria exilis TaxID=1010633 RepID=A0A835FCP9_9POAL|nr:hypothetical protein HU200_013408 [Digitaria exilis]
MRQKGHAEWVLKHYVNLEPLNRRIHSLWLYEKHVKRPWVMVPGYIFKEESEEANSYDEDDGQEVDSHDEDAMDGQEVDIECDTSVQYVNTDEEEEEDEVESEKSDQYANTDEEEVDSQDISCDDEDEVEGAHEWNSDDDDILDINKCKWEEEWTIGTMNILGLNPYKDVAFLSQGYDVVAYHLTSSKAQYLGNTCPPMPGHSSQAYLYESYLYTPCLIDSLPENST